MSPKTYTQVTKAGLEIKTARDRNGRRRIVSSRKVDLASEPSKAAARKAAAAQAAAPGKPKAAQAAAEVKAASKPSKAAAQAASEQAEAAEVFKPKKTSALRLAVRAGFLRFDTVTYNGKGLDPKGVKSLEIHEYRFNPYTETQTLEDVFACVTVYPTRKDIQPYYFGAPLTQFTLVKHAEIEPRKPREPKAAAEPQFGEIEAANQAAEIKAARKSGKAAQAAAEVKPSKAKSGKAAAAQAALELEFATITGVSQAARKAAIARAQAAAEVKPSKAARKAARKSGKAA
jgi:hypothetical protein